MTPATAAAVDRIAADGYTHPAPPVARDCEAIPPAIDPYTRVGLPVLAAFRRGAQAGRTVWAADPFIPLGPSLLWAMWAS